MNRGKEWQRRDVSESEICGDRKWDLRPPLLWIWADAGDPGWTDGASGDGTGSLCLLFIRSGRPVEEIQDSGDGTSWRGEVAWRRTGACRRIINRSLSSETSEKNRRLCLLFLQAIKNPSCAGRTGRYRGRRLYVVQGIEPSDLSKYSMGKQSRLQRPLRVYTGTGSVAFFCGRNNAYSDFPGVLWRIRGKYTGPDYRHPLAWFRI